MPPHSQRVAVKARCTRVDAAELTARQTNAEAGWKFDDDRLPQNSFTVGSDGTKRGGDVAHGDIAVVHLQNQAFLDIARGVSKGFERERRTECVRSTALTKGNVQSLWSAVKSLKSLASLPDVFSVVQIHKRKHTCSCAFI